MQNIRKRIKVIIFGTDTWAGKWFDIVLIASIVLSIIVVLIDSVADYHQKYGDILIAAELIFTIMFTVEYFLRWFAAKNRFSYFTDIYSIVDLVAILPTVLISSGCKPSIPKSITVLFPTSTIS